MRLRPDPATVVELEDGHAQVWCAVVDASGAPWPVDPRTALLQVVDRVSELADDLRFGAELEFYLLGADGLPVDHAQYYSDLDGPGAEVVLRAASTLVARGISITAVHSEAGPGQYELDLGLLPPLAFADAVIRTKDVLRRVARKEGLAVTFMARPLPGEPGSGLHVMQSSPLLARRRRQAHRARQLLRRRAARARGGVVRARRQHDQLVPAPARRPRSARRRRVGSRQSRRARAHRCRTGRGVGHRVPRCRSCSQRAPARRRSDRDGRSGDGGRARPLASERRVDRRLRSGE